MLLEDEIKTYPKENNERFLYYYLYKGQDVLEHFKSSNRIQEASRSLDNNKQVVLDNIIERMENFPPDKNGKYSTGRIEEFVDKVILQQLNDFYSEWTSQQLLKQEVIRTEKFKSLKAQLLVTFWKFYLLKDRKARKSDVFDMAIVSILPYVDLVITEKNMKNDIDQIKKKKLLFMNLKTMTVNDLRKLAPNTMQPPA